MCCWSYTGRAGCATNDLTDGWRKPDIWVTLSLPLLKEQSIHAMLVHLQTIISRTALLKYMTRGVQIFSRCLFLSPFQNVSTSLLSSSPNLTLYQCHSSTTAVLHHCTRSILHREGVNEYMPSPIKLVDSISSPSTFRSTHLATGTEAQTVVHPPSFQG